MSDSKADEKVAMLQGEIDNLNQKIAFLESKLNELQHNRSIPRSPWAMKTCQRCGINLEGALGYVCSDKECPTFFVAT